MRELAYRPSASAVDVADPVKADIASHTVRVPAWLWYLVTLFPAYATALSYASWFLAWIILGRPPVPNVDDPKSIHILVTILTTVSEISLSVSPILLPVIFFLVAYYPTRGRRRTAVVVLLILFFAVLYTGLIALLMEDPIRVMEWIGD